MESQTSKREYLQGTEEDKTVAIVAYLTIVGLAVAYFMNQEKKDEFANFHIRQSLGLVVCSLALFVVGLVPILGWIASFLGSALLLVLWVFGLVHAINGRFKTVPLLGGKFNQWFKNI